MRQLLPTRRDKRGMVDCKYPLGMHGHYKQMDEYIVKILSETQLSITANMSLTNSVTGQ